MYVCMYDYVCMYVCMIMYVCMYDYVCMYVCMIINRWSDLPHVTSPMGPPPPSKQALSLLWV